MNGSRRHHPEPSRCSFALTRKTLVGAGSSTGFVAPTARRTEGEASGAVPVATGAASGKQNRRTRPREQPHHSLASPPTVQPRGPLLREPTPFGNVTLLVLRSALAVVDSCVNSADGEILAPPLLCHLVFTSPCEPSSGRRTCTSDVPFLSAPLLHRLPAILPGFGVPIEHSPGSGTPAASCPWEQSGAIQRLTGTAGKCNSG